MMISTKGRYALRVMTELATEPAEKMLPLKEVAKKQQISEKYLEALLKGLVKQGLVVGARGKGGGYRLAKAPEKCTVWEILEAAEGSLAPVACMEAERKPCPRADRCATLPMWQGLDRVIREYFNGITLAQLAQQVGERGADPCGI